MARKDESPATLGAADWAEKARQMHDDLMGLLCAGVIKENSRRSREWMDKSYQALVGRLRQLVKGSAVEHLLETPDSLVEMCLALGQVQVLFNAVRAYMESEGQAQFGFGAGKQE